MINTCFISVSSVGKYVDRFEEELANYTGVKRAIAVVNGTAALHVSLLLVGVQANDEVLIPSLTFIATANAVTYCGAIPHFIDSEERTLGIDVDKLRAYLLAKTEIIDGHCVNRTTKRRIRALVPMHTFGHPNDLNALVQLCADFRLQLVEDAAESLGSRYEGKHTGTFGRVAALSFNGNKIITTGGGGAILTNDEELGHYAKHLTTTAKVAHQWAFIHDETGFNYRMPNLNAALGVAQLEQLPLFLVKKRQLAQRYERALRDVKGVQFITEPQGSESNYWLNTIKLPLNDGSLLHEVLTALHGAKIFARPIWVTKLLQQTMNRTV